MFKVFATAATAAICLALFPARSADATTPAPAPIDLEAALSQSVLPKGKTQTIHIRIGLKGLTTRQALRARR